MKELERQISKAFEDMFNNYPFYYGTNARYPWHYLLLNNLKWYRKYTKGLWARYKASDNYIMEWMRLKDLDVVFGNPFIVEDWRKKWPTKNQLAS